ncbi:MAG: FAD-dependent oxidoreductase [Paracoccaceae bacterium]|nr:FAD-dependent oxidoreductase [Paracoccaceae bacterium]
MTRDARYDILFEPVKIGPVTAPNRFYQVPHCNGMGHRFPAALAAMRGIKAEGAWGVVCTEEVEIHPSTDISPHNEGRLWEDADIPYHAKACEAIHVHGALAGIELVHQGPASKNRLSRIPAMGPSHAAIGHTESLQARAMDKADIRALRGWYRDAALRARRAGYDIVYVYAGHDLSILQHFISRRWNQRMDEYGGSIENRARLMREVLEDTKEAVGDTCGIAVRFAVDELDGPDGITHDGDGRAVVELLADLPDLWDVNVSDWSNDSQTARFAPDEGYQDAYTSFVKEITEKPVVGVGRFNSVDAMVSRIRKGVLDLIGAARPSIADPFLPRKIEEGRIDEIRECIGCNICVTGDNFAVPIRCTQNPTMGEEWRRCWHPERIAPKTDDDPVLVIGAGPAGLECAMQFAKRGTHVTLAEATGELGGRARREAALPGLASYMRVHDYRVQHLKAQPHVEIYLESEMTPETVRELGIPHVFLATGARWRADGIGRQLRKPLDGLGAVPAYTPDDIMDGAALSGRVAVYDDDDYYMGGVLAEKLARDGCAVTLVTASPIVSPWTVETMEQHRVQARLMELGVELALNRRLVRMQSGGLRLACIHTGQEEDLEADATAMVTERIPADDLANALKGDAALNLQVIGDAFAPGHIAAAVYSGHLAARRHGEACEDMSIYRAERTQL